ncbi:LysR family transcriptional regulator [Nguyenibacter vanlangensis]|uniref:LysR family transcriptional regulator n=1 Tax=Nguyenibacter vanlangensis TaxID=1216886 RepID=A0ABZ3D9M9_9PROT
MIGSLTLDQLRVLVAIAETGSFSAAGRRLGRVQSAISQSILALEGAQGVVLFDRSRHRPILTEQGRVLVDQARLVLAGAARFAAVAAGMHAGIEPELTLVIDPLVPSEPLVKSLQALQVQFPDLPVRFQAELIGGAARRLRARDAAVAICLLLPVVPPDLTAYPLSTLDLVPVAAPHHPLAGAGRPLDRHDLAPHVQLVLSDPNAEDGREYGIVSNRQWRFVDQGRRLDFLLAGFGWCKMPAHLVAGHIAGGRLVALPVRDEIVHARPSLVVYAAHLSTVPLGPAAGWLLRHLQEEWKLS